MQVRKEHWDVIVGISMRSSTQLGNSFGVNFTLAAKNRPVTNFTFTVAAPVGLTDPNLITSINSGERMC
jgi:predicted amidohydrolase